MYDIVESKIENLEVTMNDIDNYQFSFESDNIDFGGLIKFDSKYERGLTVVEWDDEVPNNWEEIEDFLIINCN
jgi:tRNA A37 threonylcarbamoyladenosine biosynthesis protein TsaE